MKRMLPSLHAQRGVALLEALLAAMILAIGLLGTIGLQARAYAALSDAGMRAEAAIAADRLLGIMNTDLDNLEDYEIGADDDPSGRLAQWHAETLRQIPGATITVAVTPADGAAPAAVDIAISWRRKADTPVNTHRVTSYFAVST
jgi:type IV pilus assembly protein PilV